MTVINEYMDAAVELGRNPVSKHQIQHECGDEQADAGRDCRTRLARPNKFSGTNADREIFIFPVQLTTCRTGNLTRLINTLAVCMCDHTIVSTTIILLLFRSSIIQVVILIDRLYCVTFLLCDPCWYV